MGASRADGGRSVRTHPPGTRVKHAQHLASLAERYLHRNDASLGAQVTSPDLASATFYATHALALDTHSVQARRVLATCYMMDGAEQVFPFAPSSLGHASDAVRVGSSRAGALAAVHLLQHGTGASFTDLQSARIYASACTALGRFREAQDALEWTTNQPMISTSTSCRSPSGSGDADSTQVTSKLDVSQARTQLGRIAMKQARYTDAAAFFTQAREYDPWNWAAYTGLCDLGLAPAAADAFPDSLLDQQPETITRTNHNSQDNHLNSESKPSNPAALSQLPTSNNTQLPTESNSRNLSGSSRIANLHPNPTANLKRARAEPTQAIGSRVSKPLRRVTPRAAALRSGMSRTNAVPPPPKDTMVPPVPQLPSRTLNHSRTTNRNVSDWDALNGQNAAKLDPRRSALSRTESRSGAKLRPASVASRTDSGLRRGMNDAKPLVGSRRMLGAKESGKVMRPASDSSKDAGLTKSGAECNTASTAIGTQLSDSDMAPCTQPTEPKAKSSESQFYALHLLRDLGEAYRLVRLFRGREAIALLDTSQVPPNSLRASHRSCASVHCLLGRALHDAGDYAEAEAHFAKAREQEPYLLMHMDIYSLVLFQLHREVPLSALAQDLLEIDPRAAVAHIAAGNTWSLQHQHDAAYQCFIQATLVAPECAYAYTLAGYEALDLEQPSRAVRLFRCARRCDKRHWNALAGLGQVYLRQGQAALASEAYVEAFLINGSNAVLLDLLGYALEQSGDWQGALVVYQRAIQMNPKAAMTRLKKAQLLLRMVHAQADDQDRFPPISARDRVQRRDAAHTELLQVCALAPMEPQVHLLLARSYMRMGGGRFASQASHHEDLSPRSTPESAAKGAKHEARPPQRYAKQIASHLAAAMDLDPSCVREVNAMGEGTKLALHAYGNASIAQDDHEDTHAYDGAFMASDGESIDGDALFLDRAPSMLHYDDSMGSADMQASRSIDMHSWRSIDMHA
ncbi:anaphase-promoting complex subunit cdc27 [Malassezia yamatoensis]|uniref:Anaphase-promoting complex subunit cdc27 n=1 Tax=Malassezia yamatoensis TaxID=253288 RepID=A0AAJ5YWT1_9BASI|nr:anaphase-promoting complex subunit cdc27 [Malassezia yamatoensis]